MKRFLFNRITFFVLFALLAIILMGATITRSTSSDLHGTAQALANESSKSFRNTPGIIATQHPGAILRANIIK